MGDSKEIDGLEKAQKYKTDVLMLLISYVYKTDMCFNAPPRIAEKAPGKKKLKVGKKIPKYAH